MKEINAILHSIINDLEKTAITVEAVKATAKGGDTQTAAELAKGINSAFYEGLRKKVDALP